MEHRGFYRRRLPHFDAANTTHFISFSLVRTHVSLATDHLERLSQPAIQRPATAPRWLARADCAAIVVDSLQFGNPERYHLLAWVIMPDHVHLILRQQPGFTLSRILNGIKSITAVQCNRVLQRNGQFWAYESWDRVIRDEAMLHDVEAYIRWNPVKAGLAELPETIGGVMPGLATSESLRRTAQSAVVRQKEKAKRRKAPWS